MRILNVVSCRGWSSDAYWAARMTQELEARGHLVTLVCRRQRADTVIARARAEGVKRIETLTLASGVKPVADIADVRHLSRLLQETDVVHVHRGKEHWLAAVANRLTRTPRPIVRTRHIVQIVRAHAPNRWLYGQATALVVAVTDAIRRQYAAAGLVPPERLVTLSGGADANAYTPGPPNAEVRTRLGAPGDALLVGMVAGLRGMKGHGVVVDAAAQLAREGVRPRLAFVGRGAMEPVIREAIRSAGIEGQTTIAGFAQHLPPVMASLDIALYVPLESEGMSRVLFEYLAAGRAVVASRVGVVPEVLTDGEHATLVPAGDAAALADALRRLIADPGRRTRQGAAGRALIEARYSGARVAEALETLYARLPAA
jgi:glycosyltransferase involved in cell wall biosynthesis